MSIDVTVTIGGEAGQGIQTVGDIIARVCHKAGLYLLAINDFESRIRGGHSFMQIRISDQPVLAPDHKIDLLIALNSDTCDLHKNEMTETGLVLLDVENDAEKDDSKENLPEAAREKNVLPIAFSQMAKDAGGKIMTNTVAAGACLALLGAPFSALEQILKTRFAEKEKILRNNITAARSGFDAVKHTDFDKAFDWPSGGSAKGRLLSGSQALAFGALAADCRLAAFYPMSPATGIMIQLAEFMDELPVLVEQTEDEISAVNMIIGASYAGVRALTATSGGGFSLMTEGLGLAGITETPVVIINSQRPGPATGLPTRTGQGDLLFVIHASQDEFPRFVFAPGSPEQAYDTMIRAFHLSEKYQVPAIILTDQYFNDSLWMTTREMAVPEEIERFVTIDEEMTSPPEYKRFAVTASGISPRALPCKGRALVCVTANEHDEAGHMSETISDRNTMVEKRQAKTKGMIREMKGPEAYHGKSASILVGWGSSNGAIREAVDLLRSENIDVGALVFSDIWPFPAKKTEEALSSCKRFITVEQNASSQLGLLIRQQTGLSFHTSLLQYDGRPFTPDWIAQHTKSVLEERP
ncbi:MAG: 2-oxoacid:acceptor oxidoreductase subunit alpha [Desulfotignum sp.]|nr:2-oxoacid:acceptor oxidoreductase subunit alpha [Desulfotignum sp.]